MEFKRNVTIERKKAINQYTSLQTKKEQLNLLIRQLENLSVSREVYFISKVSSEINDELDYIQSTSRGIRNELTKALKDHEEVNKDIIFLKSKIEQLDKTIAR